MFRIINWFLQEHIYNYRNADNRSRNSLLFRTIYEKWEREEGWGRDRDRDKDRDQDRDRGWKRMKTVICTITALKQKQTFCNYLDRPIARCGIKVKCYQPLGNPWLIAITQSANADTYYIITTIKTLWKVLVTNKFHYWVKSVKQLEAD